MLKKRVSKHMHRARIVCIGITTLQLCFGGTVAPSALAQEGRGRTLTLIKHVIVIVGENRTFDHIFATYKPVAGETVSNLLSKEIVREDGTPGEHFSRARQYQADVTGSTTFQLSPTSHKKPYKHLPAPLNGGPTDVCRNNGICTLGDATSSEDGLAADYYQFLLTGGSELSGKVPDSRISGVNSTPPYSTLPPGPFQLTKNPSTFPYDSYAASPVHRFYQMCKCGSRWIATRSTSLSRMPAAARPIFFPGSR
jgi:phospholipase C